MTNYTNQIEEIAEYAKANGLNPDTDFDVIMKGWIKMTYERSIWIQNNKSKAINIIKRIL